MNYKNLSICAITLLISALIFIDCNSNGGNSAGDMVTYTADGVSFNMVYVPGGLTFPTGLLDDGIATVSSSYWIGETEVTWELWSKVKTWAENNASNLYTFANPGVMGDGTGDNVTHPVTTVNWRDAMAWTNALTEWYNAHIRFLS